MGWLEWIVPVAGGIIVLGIIVVAWVSIRGRGQMPHYHVAKPPKSHNRHVNPKTGSRF